MPPFTVHPTPFAGAHLVESRVFRDARGVFVKTFHQELFAALGLPAVPLAEEFWSSSGRGVLRGMHFQNPPAAHAKVVTCLAGRVLDVLVDLRRAEPTFGQAWSVELGAETGRLLILPVGIAHGFLSLEDGSVMLYKTSTVHAPAQDAGIRWDSFGFAWPTTSPIVSDRDARHPALADFVSMF